MRDASDDEASASSISDDEASASSSSDDDAVEAFISRETKKKELELFEQLLTRIRRARERDVDEILGASAEERARDPEGLRWAPEAGLGAERVTRNASPAFGGRGSSDEDVGRVARWPLKRCGRIRETIDIDAGNAIDGEDLVTGAYGYSIEELERLESAGLIRERRGPATACERHFRRWGRVWEGTISIPGSGGDDESPYAFQVLWYDAVAGRYLISHTAQGDEQLCHLTMNDDGDGETMSISYADNETYCSGTIHRDTGVISGTVGQLVRAEEGFFEQSDSSRNTFTLTPVDFEGERPTTCETQAQIARVKLRHHLVAQWSRGANVLPETYSAIQHVKDHMRSEHMCAYLLRKISHETLLMRMVYEPLTEKERDLERNLKSHDVDEEPSMILEFDEREREVARMLWATFPTPGVLDTTLVGRERDWCHIWTMERMNAELLSCKFRMYSRVLRDREFPTSDYKENFTNEFKTLRHTCHIEMNRVVNNMNLLLWRMFYGSEVSRIERQILIKNMVGILRVEEARMLIAYENVDKALRECDARLPLDAIERRLSVAADESYTCSICLLEIDKGEEVLTLDCSHSFHPPCCAQWLHAHATCPNCRTILT
ncbi:Zinc finger, RING/FYVE/PHD-type [Ostreococcus tauri]|uniref:RING-type E3 ubiquitin transferase n=1 Tax=Ostreococcus tauri TaxID=70448 RepID=A0A090M9Q4_OSTTA|nr:Zinc finger, RING/FYVE/PHD-type [Ostreococcus tauri]CEF99452.1 Zinc finger, RING/FYVE/PHD-type [Ostreococcus tauri]|eukprot:XP_003081730.2 Zinc finger, RING/FYVE/PHD-type [Ostreococcus tauri]